MNIDQLRLVASAAALAPSIHNTQPWRFDLHDGDTLDVFADRERQVLSVDPSGRQLLLSCGGAVEYARLALRAQGYDSTVAVLPDPTRPHLVATIAVRSGRAVTSEERALVDAMGVRHTDRGPYDDTPLPALLVEELRSGIERFGLWLRQVDLPVDRVVMMAALTDAERRQAADPAYVEEIARWTHRPTRQDGVAEAAAAWPADRVSDMPLRDFSGHAQHRGPQAGDPPTVERDALLLLGSLGDDSAAHVAAGRALAWLLLRVTVDGLSAQPLMQALDDVNARLRLARDLRLIGHPQFLLRLGVGHAAAQAGRRGLSDVLVSPH